MKHKSSGKKLELLISQQVKSLPAHLGAIDQFIDSTDVLESSERIDKLKAMYQS